MYAIIEAGGKQYRVAEGDVIRCDLVASEVGSDVTFERVVLAASGDDVAVGNPTVSGASVTGTVLRQG
ncbi:MAG TPA: 50S ribosomal protein L21, partial [Candidatus Cybelea sp.]